MNEKSSEQLVLEEFQRCYDKAFATGDTLDGKLQNMLNFLSAIVAIVPAIAGSALFDKVSWSFWVPTFAVLILYLWCFLDIMRGLNPSQYIQPITSNWDDLKTRCFDAAPSQAAATIISSYIEALGDAERQGLRKAKVVRNVAVRMAVIVGLLMISVPIGLILWPPSLGCLLGIAKCGP